MTIDLYYFKCINIMEIFIVLAKNSNIDKKYWEKHYLKSASILEVWGPTKTQMIWFWKETILWSLFNEINWLLMFLGKSTLWHDYKMTKVFTEKRVAKNN